jgi:hypothetical protein
MLFPSGRHTGAFASEASRRAAPPSAGATHRSPPKVRVFLASVPPMRMRPVRDERVEMKAIELPSGENAGWMS